MKLWAIPMNEAIQNYLLVKQVMVQKMTLDIYSIIPKMQRQMHCLVLFLHSYQ